MIFVGSYRSYIGPFVPSVPSAPSLGEGRNLGKSVPVERYIALSDSPNPGQKSGPKSER